MLNSIRNSEAEMAAGRGKHEVCIDGGAMKRA
jgi:hypothetical protein